MGGLLRRKLYTDTCIPEVPMGGPVRSKLCTDAASVHGDDWQQVGKVTRRSHEGDASGNASLP
jgi:hypothetical protein